MVQDSVIGLAWVSGMCHPEFSCTINEGHNYESVYVIAHEMGHNLGTDMQATSDDIVQYSERQLGNSFLRVYLLSFKNLFILSQ